MLIHPFSTSDKPRTLALEQSFFDSISHYFRTTPIVPLSQFRTSSTTPDRPAMENDTAASSSLPQGGCVSCTSDAEDDTFAPRLYIYQRWRLTSSWRMPERGQEVMNGVTASDGVKRGRDFGYTEQMFAALEWD